MTIDTNGSGRPRRSESAAIVAPCAYGEFQNKLEQMAS